MKLLRRSSSARTPDKIAVSQQSSHTENDSLEDGSPTRVQDFDALGAAGDKPPSKCVLDVSILAGNRMDPRYGRSVRNNSGSSSFKRSSSGDESKEDDAREVEAEPRSSNSSSTNQSKNHRRRRAQDSTTTRPPASSVEAKEFMMEESSVSQQDNQIYSVPDIFSSLAQSTSYTKGSRSKSKKSIAPMPTLSEAAREEDESTVGGGPSEEQSSFDSWDESNLSFEVEVPVAASPQRPASKVPQSPSNANGNIVKTKSNNKSKNKIPPAVQPTVTQLLAMDEHRKACEQIRKLMQDAKAQGAEGREEDSIQTYKNALQIGRADVHRIKAHLRKPSGLSERFYQDWLEIGVLLSEIRTCQAHLHERMLDYDHAISCIQESVSIYRRQTTFFKSRSKDKAATLSKVIGNLEAVVARIRTAQKHEAKRKQAHQNILQLQRLAASEPGERRETYLQMEAAAEKLRESEIKVMGEWHPLVADASSLLGAIALEQGKIDAAVSCMKQALIIMKKALGMRHPRTGTKLLILASIYANQGHDSLAIDHYNMAIAVFRSCDSLKLVASTLNDVSVIHIRRKEYAPAIDLLRDSIDIYQKQAEHSWDTAQVWRNLGECYCQQREYSQGSSALLNALNIQRDGRALYDKAMTSNETTADNVPPFHLVDDTSIADTLRRLGKAYFGARQFDYALTYYKEACIIHKAEVKKVVQVSKSRSNLSLPARQDELAQTIYCMAELYDHTGELEQAAKLFSESLQLRLFSDAHKESRSNMVHCAMCLYGMGGIHIKQGEFDEASAVIEQALSYCDAHGIPDTNVIYIMIRTRLDEANKNLAPPPEADESNASLNSSIDENEETVSLPSFSEIESLELTAAEAINEGNLDDAVAQLTRVMQKRKILLQALKHNGEKGASLKYDTACTLFKFGQVLTMQRNYASAEKAFKDSLKLFKRSGTPPDTPVVLRLCEALKKILETPRA